MRTLLALTAVVLATMCGCSLFSSLNYGEELTDWRRQWEDYNRINESTMNMESLPDPVQDAIDGLNTQDSYAAPKIFMLSRQGKFLAYRIVFDDDVEYCYDVEGTQIEKPASYPFNTHGGVI